MSSAGECQEKTKHQEQNERVGASSLFAGLSCIIQLKP